MKTKKWFLAMMVALSLCMSVPVHATTMLLLTREELLLRSDIVVRARVGKAISSPLSDGLAMVTRTELIVTQPLKGKVEGALWVSQFGGKAEGKTQKVAGDAALHAGEDVVVFLRRDEKGKTYLTALSQSVWHVDEKGMAKRDLEGATFLRYEGNKAIAVVPIESKEPVEALMTEIVRLAGRK